MIVDDCFDRSEESWPTGVELVAHPALDLAMIEEGFRLVLAGLQVDLTNGNYATTPRRAAKVMSELFVPRDTEWPVFDEDYTDLVIMRNFTFFTLCPHHMLPVKITASLAYIPAGRVIGASKLCRMLLEVNRKPETQEKLTSLALEAVDKLTGATSQGAIVLLRGEHGCFQMRGVRTCADMVTLKASGVFKTDGEMEKRFLTLVKV